MAERQREAFEKWVRGKGGPVDRDKDTGTYLDLGVRNDWRVWQAALSHAEGEAVTFTCHGNSAPAYSCNKPGDMSGTYYPAPQVVMPEGWLIRRVDDRITVQHPDFGGYCASVDEDDSSAIAPVILYHLANALLAAAPTARAGEADDSDICEQVELPHVLAWADGIRGDMWTEYADRITDEEARVAQAVWTAHTGEPVEWPEPQDAMTAQLQEAARKAGYQPHEVDGRLAMFAAHFAGEQPVSDPDGLPESPRPMATAPRDSTMVRLLVQFTENGVSDGFEIGPAWTIGTNTYDDSGDDEWYIAGWNWQQDCFTAGEGEPLGWLPMLSAPAPDEREIAALALDDMADTIAAMSDESDNSAASKALYRAAARCNARAGRLRAGKEGEDHA